MKSNPLYEFYYLWSVALLIPVWAVVFFTQKKSRLEMAYVGLLCGTGALLFDRYSSFYDYWRPPTQLELFNFESLLYGFFVGGISSKIYEFIVRKERVSGKPPSPLFILAAVVFNALMFVSLRIAFRLNSVDVFVYMLLTSTAIFVLIRPRLILVGLGSGIVMTLLITAWYAVILRIYPDAIKDIWLKTPGDGMFLWGIPIEEHLFIFVVGCSSSLVYKVASGVGKKHSAIFAKSGAGDEPFMPGILKQLILPAALLMIVLCRMIFFGNAPIRLSKIVQMFH